jgi:hypothetical protein
MGAMTSGPGRGAWRKGASKIHGQGVLAAKDLAPGSLIGVGIGFHLGIFPAVTTDFGAWINHSYSPTAQLLLFDNAYWVVASHRILEGDEITLDYRRTPWYIKKPEPHFK